MERDRKAVEEGVVVGIHIAPASSAPMRAVDEVCAVAGQCLEGDRYYTNVGTNSNVPEPGREVTLVEAEVLEWGPSVRIDGQSCSQNISAAASKLGVCTRRI